MQSKEGKCVVCLKPISNSFTCSNQCAGLLSQSSKEVKILREQFNTPEKKKIREFLFKQIPELPFEKTPLGCNILDFWGGGLFSDYIIDQSITVKNHCDDVNLYELDSNKKLWPALRKYALIKNQDSLVQNQNITVIPYCGSLAEFVHKMTVKNHVSFDLIWLDYCGTYQNLREDTEFVKKISTPKTLIAVTVCRWADDAIDKRHREKDMGMIISDYLPLHRKIYEKYYTKKGNMIFNVFRASSKLLKQKWTTQLYG